MSSTSKVLFAVSVTVAAIVAIAMVFNFSSERGRWLENAHSSTEVLNSDNYDNASSKSKVRASDGENSSLWELLVSACRRRSYAEASQIALGVMNLPLRTRLEVLALSQESDLSVQDAKALSSIIKSLLSTEDETEALIICDAVIDELSRQWPTFSKLAGSRKERYAQLVLDKPISVPERAAYGNSDILLIGVYLQAAEYTSADSAGNRSGIVRLFDAAASMPQTERAFLEPSLSAILGILSDRKSADVPRIAAKYREKDSLSARLRWELRLRSSDRGNLAQLLELLESQTNINDVIKALRGVVSAGLSIEDLLAILCPYLDSRFGSQTAAQILHSTLLRDFRAMTLERRREVANSVAASLLSVQGGSGLATIYTKLLSTITTASDMEQARYSLFKDSPDTSNDHRLLDIRKRNEVREALTRHWLTVAADLGKDDLSTNMPSEVCIVCIEASASLEKAVESVETIVGSITHDVEMRALRADFAKVLMRLRAYFFTDLEREPTLRQRVVVCAERVLKVAEEGRYVMNADEMAVNAANLLLLSDQLLAVCSVRPEIRLSLKSADAIRMGIASFERTCCASIDGTMTPHRSWKHYESPYRRVVTVVKNELIVPTNK